MNMKQKFSISFLAVALVVTPLSIVTQEKVNFAKANESNITTEKTEINRINKLDKFVKFDKQNMKFYYSNSDKLERVDLEYLNTKINEANDRLSKIKITNKEQIHYSSNKVVVTTKPKLDPNNPFRYAEGIDAIDFYWWGMDIWLSKTTLNRAIKTGVIIGGIVIAKHKVLAALQILGVWGGPIPGGIYMKVHYPFGIAEVRWHG